MQQVFPYGCGIDPAKSGLDTRQKRTVEMMKQIWQVGFTTPEKKLAML